MVGSVVARYGNGACGKGRLIARWGGNTQCPGMAPWLARKAHWQLGLDMGNIHLLICWVLVVVVTRGTLAMPIMLRNTTKTLRGSTFY